MSSHRHEKIVTEDPKPIVRSKSPSRANNYDCRLCKEDHALRKCVRFNKMNVFERRQVVRLFKYCKNCLAHSHLFDHCRAKGLCRHCGAQHHSLLHCHERLEKRTRSEVPTASFGVVISTILPQVKLHDVWRPIRGLLNPCVEFSSIAHSLIKTFVVPVERVGDEDWCVIAIRSRFDEGPIFRVDAKVTKDLPTLLRRKRLEDRVANSFTHLRLADPDFYLNGDICLILGADVYPLLIRNSVQPQSVGMAMAQDTILGWTIIGRVGA